MESAPSHAGVALVRALGDMSKALASRRLLIHDRGRVLSDLACATADGAEAVSDFQVIGDQGELLACDEGWYRDPESVGS